MSLEDWFIEILEAWDRLVSWFRTLWKCIVWCVEKFI